MRKGTRNKFRKFCCDERLDGIRKDVSLCHTALSLGTYKSGGNDVSSSTNTRSSKKKKNKKCVGGSSSVKNKGGGSKDDDARSTTTKKKRKRDSSTDAGEDSSSKDTAPRNYPRSRCILCAALEQPIQGAYGIVKHAMYIFA